VQVCRMPRAATQVLAGADGRRPTSAKARNRGGEAAAMVAQLYGDLRPVGEGGSVELPRREWWPGRCRMRLWFGRRRAVTVER
jgi:hypothetical protein